MQPVVYKTKKLSYHRDITQCTM